MTEARDSKTRRSPEAPARDSFFGAAGSTTIEPFMQASNRLLEAWMTVSNELLEFGKARLDQSLAISKALAKSASLNEAIELQSQYAQTVVQDYVAEANKIVDLGTRSLLDGMSQLRPVSNPAAKHAEAAE